jgi:NTE family protein
MSGAVTPRIGLALGGGSARGLAHIPMLEALGELGLRPDVIAGTSMGAIVGAMAAAGRSAAEVRAFAEDLLGTRRTLFRRLAGSLDGLPRLWSLRTPSVVDGVTLFEMLAPAELRVDIASLPIPYRAIAADYHAMCEVVLDHGPLIPAVAASAALPSILRPVSLAGRVLIDGGFVNPTPWDVIQGAVDITVAIDVTGVTLPREPGAVPTPLEAWIGASQIMFRQIVREKLARRPPDLLITPDVGAFTTLDFLRIREIFAAAAPAKEQLKRELDRIVGAWQRGERQSGAVSTLPKGGSSA